MSGPAGESPGSAEHDVAQLDAVLAEIDGRALPPVQDWHPTRSGEIDIRIARDGSWFYKGSRIERARMVSLFASVLRVDEAGTWLVTPVEKLRIRVDDAPFVAVSLERLGEPDEPSLVFRTNVGERVVADAAHPITVRYAEPGGEPSPYVLVRDRLQALIARQTFIELAGLATRRGDSLGVCSCGTFMPLGPVDDSAA